MSCVENVEILNNCERKIIEYNKTGIMPGNRALYIKVQNIIKDAKIKKYVKESSEISSEGISFWGAFTGKNSLQLERMRNVKLKIELLQSQKIAIKEEYEEKDMMADLYACAISEFGGKFTNEMQNVYNQVKESCKENETVTVTDENVQDLALKKVAKGQSYLPIIHQEKPKGIFGDTKMQTEFYKIENKRLENQIILERGKGQFGTFEYYGKNTGVIIPVSIKTKKD